MKMLSPRKISLDEAGVPDSDHDDWIPFADRQRFRTGAPRRRRGGKRQGRGRGPVKAKPSRLLKVAKLLIKTLENNSLSPNAAAKLFGQLDFLNTTLFGRVGRSGLAFIKSREQCST